MNTHIFFLHKSTQLAFPNNVLITTKFKLKVLNNKSALTTVIHEYTLSEEVTTATVRCYGCFHERNLLDRKI